MKIQFLILVLGAVFLGGCQRNKLGVPFPSAPQAGQPPARVDCSDPQNSGDEPCVDAATAAQYHCISVGGQATGTDCRFGKASIDQVTLYRFQVKNVQVSAVVAFLTYPAPAASGAGDPASSYCKQVGGLEKEGEPVLCVFRDQSAIGETTLFRGPNNSENAQLTAVITRTLFYLSNH